MNKPIQEKIKNMPLKPGVYIMKDDKKAVLYVGKAKSLKKRVENYFASGREKRNSVLLFVPRIKDIEFIVTDNETEAFLLENTLIKKLKPRYNINLRDDKEFLCIRLDPGPDFPRLTFIRRPRNDGALYFGPYSSGNAIKLTLKSVGKIFPLRRCSDHIFNNRSRPCILYQIKLCNAPCVGLITKEDYSKIVEDTVSFLKGNTRDIQREYSSAMESASTRMEYEEAAKYRDRLKALEDVMTEQKVISKDFRNRDVFGFARKDEHVAVSVLPIREGRLSGGKNFKLKAKYLDDKEAFSSFLSQYYLDKASFTPSEILIPPLLAEKALFVEALSKNERAVPRILVPQKGAKKKLIEMACQNARQTLYEIQTEEEKSKELLETARIKLKLSKIPLRIEGYDISNLQGEAAVGSMVVFEGGRPQKDAYRKFKIKNATGPDDFSMMSEILFRRLSNDELGALPDLIVVDGGKGQLNRVLHVLNEKSYEHIDTIAIAKEKSRKAGKVYDRIFIKGRKNPLNLKLSLQVLNLIGRVRDEAHRFAVGYHRKLRTIKPE